LKKSFEYWQKIGRALKLLRKKADLIGGRRTFDNLRDEAGLGEKQITISVVSKLLRVMDDLDAVVR
jgi:hypothetical protein